MKNIFCHIEIRTRDLEKAREFYEDLFNWKVKVGPESNYALIDTGKEPGGGLFQAPKQIPLGVTPHVLVDEIELTLNKVEELGGRIIVGKQEVPEMGWFAVFADPEGNVLGLWQPLKQEI